MTILEGPLADLSRQATPYPAFVLDTADTALALFAAGFLGVNDAIHFARNDIQATCVDSDPYKLDKMQQVYPVWWDFQVSDAWEFAQKARERGETWDVVSADTFLGDAEKKSLRSLDLWCSIAEKAVTVTIGGGRDWDEIPDGWEASRFPRTYRADWLVMTRG